MLETVLLIAIVAVLTVFAVAVGYRMGRGHKTIFPSVGKRVETDRKAAIVAENIERYDGTANGQKEVK